MNGYVLVRTSDGKYVARPGLDKSYTDRLELAQTFRSRDEAASAMCVESESIVPLAWILTQS